LPARIDQVEFLLHGVQIQKHGNFLNNDPLMFALFLVLVGFIYRKTDARVPDSVGRILLQLACILLPDL